MTQLLEPSVWSVQNIFSSCNYVVPVYQRPYSWAEAQTNSFLNDAFKSYSYYKKNINSNELDDNSILFAGTIYLRLTSMKNNLPVYDVVDGQQRITTCTLILIVLLNMMNNSEMSADEFSEVSLVRQFLWKKDDKQKICKNLQVLTLGSIDSNKLNELLNELFDKKDVFSSFDNTNSSEFNHAEIHLLKNLKCIKDCIIQNGIKEPEEIASFFNFFISNVKFISIVITTSMSKMFELFESINGKGKKLEEIDLIKSYLFQNISEGDYDDYLNKWGKLIVATNDNLIDYLTVYIRANIGYSEKGLRKDKIQKLIENELQTYLGIVGSEDTSKAFIDDLNDKVSYYRFIKNIDGSIANPPIKLSDTVKSYILMSSHSGYVNDKPLCFKLLLLFKQGKVKEAILEKLLRLSFNFIFTFQTVGSKESKNTIKVLKAVQSTLLWAQTIDDNVASQIEYQIKLPIKEAAFDDNIVSQLVPQSLSYNNKDVCKTVLSYVNFFDESSNQIDYSKLFSILSSLWNSFQVDHILPRNPDEEGPFSYWSSNKESKVHLKPNQDFYDNSNGTIEEIDKDEFEKNFLHPIANLRLEWGKDNICKGNNLVELKDVCDISYIKTWNDIKKRSSRLVQKIISSGIILTKENIGELDSYSNAKLGKEELIEVNHNQVMDTDIAKYATDSRVDSYKLFSNEYVLKNKTYTSFLKNLCQQLYKNTLYTEKLKKLANSKYCPFSQKRVSIASSLEDITNQEKAFEISKEFYIDILYSGAYSLKLAYKILEEIGISGEELTVTLKRKK